MENVFEVVFYFVVGETQKLDSVAAQVIVALGVLGLLYVLVVVFSIDFYREAILCTPEIENDAAYGMLSSKLRPTKLPIS